MDRTVEGMTVRRRSNLAAFGRLLEIIEHGGWEHHGRLYRYAPERIFGATPFRFPSNRPLVLDGLGSLAAPHVVWYVPLPARIVEPKTDHAPQPGDLVATRGDGIAYAFGALGCCGTPEIAQREIRGESRAALGVRNAEPICLVYPDAATLHIPGRTCAKEVEDGIPR